MGVKISSACFVSASPYCRTPLADPTDRRRRRDSSRDYARKLHRGQGLECRDSVGFPRPPSATRATPTRDTPRLRLPPERASSAGLRALSARLQLNPRHRGAHEYIGEAYLMANNLNKAEEHLGRPAAICLSLARSTRTQEGRRRLSGAPQSEASRRPIFWLRWTAGGQDVTQAYRTLSSAPRDVPGRLRTTAETRGSYGFGGAASHRRRVGPFGYGSDHTVCIRQV